MTDGAEQLGEYRLSRHAQGVIERRGIKPTWITRTLADPVARRPDAIDPNLTHALRPIAEFGGRVLRVVYNGGETPPLVITAFFDRSKKGKL
ncbi:MAG TPA: DUF4258 domain-containing protein [Phycisphaerales bacterium]|nr:DUF4258 domain-containing protein [Phycisphaerales bacterium]